MKKKNLPKAIRREADGLGQVSFGSDADGHPEALARATDSKSGGGNVVAGTGPAPNLAPPPVGRVLVSRALAHVDAARRLSRAHAIVERHATYSAAGGIIPLPVANAASVMAIIVRMVKMLSNLYGVPFERDRARALVVGMAGGATPIGLGAITSSTLYYLVPASAVIGLAVSSVAAVACTRSIGRTFVEHFESGATLGHLSANEKANLPDLMLDLSIGA
jgi:uncharacterized protein (DUF697 family)